MPDNQAPKPWVCIYHTRIPAQAEELKAVLSAEGIAVRQRTILEQGQIMPEERLFVSPDHEAAALEVLNRWLDQNVVVDETNWLDSFQPDVEKQSGQGAGAIVFILLPGIFVVCYLFLKHIAGLSSFISAVLSLPLPIGVYLFIRKAQQESM